MTTMSISKDGSLTPLGASRQSRILVVEDNSGDAELVRAVLEQNVESSIEIAQSNRLTDAIRRIAVERFDLIVLDLGLPDSKGFETLERILAVAASIPIIVLTGQEDPDLAEKLIGRGAKECLCKNNVSGELLVHAITRCMKSL